jgi:hypothetical protein
MKKRYKKGVLFTVITFLLISSLLMFLFAFNKRIDLRNEIAIESYSPIKIKNIERIIARDYLKIMDFNKITLNSNTEDTNITLNINLTENNKNYRNLLNEYILFMNNVYSQMSNTNLSINLDNSIKILPYNTIIKRDKTNLNISLDDNKMINIDVVLNIEPDEIYYNSNSFNNGDNNFQLRIYDNNKDIIFQRTEKINLSLLNYYYLETNTTIPFPSFNITINNKEIKINTLNDIKADIKITLNYELDRKIYITTYSNSTINTDIIKKNSPITLITN